MRVDRTVEQTDQIQPAVAPNEPAPSGSPLVPEGAAEAGLVDLAQYRQGQGMAPGEGTFARLDVCGRTFYGRNAHGKSYPRPFGVTFQSLRHAEGDAFGQAALAGVQGGDGVLFVDRAVCGFCKSSLRGYVKLLGLDRLFVVEPGASVKEIK